MPEVTPRDWNNEALDASTGWPRWRCHEAEKLARKMDALMMEKVTPEAVKHTFQMLGIEAHLEAANDDMLNIVAATAGSMNF